MFKEAVYAPGTAPGAPAYSPALTVEVGDCKMIYLTGQTSIDQDGGVVCPGDVAGQAEQAFKLAEQLLKAAGAGLNDVVKAQIFLTDVNDYPQVAPVRNKYFAKNRPVSTIVAVNALTTPGCKVELDLVAIVKK